MAKVTVKHSRLSRGSSLAMILLGVFATIFLGPIGVGILAVGIVMYWFYRRQSRSPPRALSS